jgi:hydroxymethylpyrimidine pyrophosphatase-like HAD family hydrolase
MALQCLYVDLDGTLLGKGASMFHDEHGNFTLLGARALEACARVGAEVVIYSGRRRAQVFEDARLLGHRAFIFEAGCGLEVDGELTYLTGDQLVAGETTIHDQITATGAPQLLLETYSGRLEYHDPWHRDREVSHLFRGEVDAFEADALLEEHSLGFLRLVDNGGIHRKSPTLVGIEQARAYHLIPREGSKARAAAQHMRIRGYDPAQCIAVGDSREDLGAADVVGTFWFVKNALERDPTLPEAIKGRTNVRVAEARHGAGVYEAVVTTLAEQP